MSDNQLQSKAFQLKGRLYTLTVLQLFNADKILFEQQLEEMIAKAPRLFDGTPIILDCSALHHSDFDLQGFYNSLRQRNILPVAIQGGDPLLSSLAQCMNLAVLNGSSSQDKPISQPIPETVPETPINKTKLHTSPVRSGQQLLAMGSDLIITSTVSHGAELLADGNIHVYGILRGRALAGISGDKTARIFCSSLDAELVAIAGCYLLNDAIKPKQGPCQIYLQDTRIIIEDLC